LRAGRYRGIVIGGVASSLLGRPRLTRDVDALVLIDETRWAKFLEAGGRYGIAPRISNCLRFAHKARVLLLRHNPSQIDIDISIGLLPFEEEALARRQFRKVQGMAIPLPSPDDLVIMKAVAHRPRDLGDIVGILEVHPGLDLSRVRRWVRDFADALGMPELSIDLERLLTKPRMGKKGKRRS
jgi:hypothetical protein